MNRFSTLILGAALSLAATLAQAQVDRHEFQIPIGPASGGWFSPGNGFGGITFDINADLGRPVMSGSWLHNREGSTRTWVFQTDVVYSTPQEVLATGIIATAHSGLFTINDRSDFDSPLPYDAPAVDTGHTLSFEFVSSRTGRVIYDRGKSTELTRPIVGTLTGLPLIAPRNYAGEWLVAARIEAPQAHRESLVRVIATPIDTPASYTISNPFNSTRNRSIPQEGARLYRIDCAPATSQESCELISNLADRCGLMCVPGTSILVLWMNPDENGSLSVGTLSGTSMTFYNFDNDEMRAYGQHDVVVARAKGGSSYIGVREIKFVRIPAGVFHGTPDM